MTGASPSLSCPDREELERIAAGADSTAAGHVEACADCRRVVDEISADNELLAEVVLANHDRLDSGAGGAHGGGAGGVTPDGYDVLEEIHRGSQGVVYRAIQRATKREVALKVVLQGTFATERQRLRFDREVELIASLRHPNIVTVYDSGIDAEGRPFLAMEHVEGVPLNGRPQPVPVRETLELFARICDAVAFAHRRGIIHRDLKPANILVDEAGEPHVLDFGLAKTVGSTDIADDALTTMAGEFLGTLAYAAPEQVAADPSLIDTRVDVYALGVVLYEMLTGRRPYDLGGSVRDVVHTITETPPIPPRSLDRDLPRDVEAITLAALAKEPERRYQSVGALADDLRHYLGGEPITVKRHDTLYVVGKLVRRHRAAVAIAAVIVVLLAGFVVAWSLDRIRDEQVTEQTIKLLVQVIGATDTENPNAPVPAQSVAEMRDRIAAIVDSELDVMPEIAATAQTDLGEAYMSDLDFDAAEMHLLKALATFRRIRTPPDADIARALHNLGRLKWKMGRFEDAAGYYRQALRMRTTLYGGDHPDVARTMHHLASALRFEGELDESERWFRDALAMRERVLNPGHADIGNNLNGLGNCLRDLERSEEALSCYRRALSMLGDARDFRAAAAKQNVARCLINLGELDEAQANLMDSLAIKLSPGAPSETGGPAAVAFLDLVLEADLDEPLEGAVSQAHSLHEFARLAQALGRTGEAERFCRYALGIRNQEYGGDHTDVAASLNVLGRILLAAGRADEAEPVLRRAFDMRRAHHGDTHWKVALAEVALGRCIAERGRLNEAESHLEHALSVIGPAMDPTGPSVDEAVEALAAVRRRLSADAGR